MCFLPHPHPHPLQDFPPQLPLKPQCFPNVCSGRSGSCGGGGDGLAVSVVVVVVVVVLFVVLVGGDYYD